ncbi:MAG TPA: hydantoinase/oxoprolinase family protein [Planctomycetes bacterium]|nr:hydantoinase/oxoprolinase family protein [Planctomycetota bacterium]
MKSVAADSGGTFTDIVFSSPSGHHVRKVPSTPEDPARAILEVLSGDQHDRAIHGSTVATNALLQRHGARVAFVTTRGFADIPAIGRQNRPRIYSLGTPPDAPLFHLRDCYQLDERIGPGGEVIRPLDPVALKRLRDDLEGTGVESVAVGLLFSSENRSHEDEVVKVLEKLGVPVIGSSRILAEPREYERFSTAIACAFVAPLMATYLERLAAALPATQLLLMDSAGGVLPWQRMRDEPVRSVLSGPAGGVVAASHRCRDGQGVAFDMGGTSTDATLVSNAEIARTRSFTIGTLPIAVPMVDTVTVGAGGGSIAWIDSGGALRVGPRSAGSVPGPACYGRGGLEATVTDAHVVLGRIPADTLLAGTLPLDREKALTAIGAFASSLGMPLTVAARGILEVIEAEMERALRRITQERGVDPRTLALISFGGAGGLHAVALARGMGMPEVRIPRGPGVLSAIGMLEAQWAEEEEQVLLCELNEESLARLRQVAGKLEATGRSRMEEAGAQTDEAITRVTLRMRHRGQSHDLEIPWQGDPREGFLDRYRQLYGSNAPDRAIEVVSVATRTVLPSREGTITLDDESDRSLDEVLVSLDDGEEMVPVRRIARGALDASEPLEGPALVVERTHTLWLPAGARLVVEDDGTLSIDPGEKPR